MNRLLDFLQVGELNGLVEEGRQAAEEERIQAVEVALRSGVEDVAEREPIRHELLEPLHDAAVEDREQVCGDAAHVGEPIEQREQSALAERDHEAADRRAGELRLVEQAAQCLLLDAGVVAGEPRERAPQFAGVIAGKLGEEAEQLAAHPGRQLVELTERRNQLGALRLERFPRVAALAGDALQQVEGLLPGQARDEFADVGLRIGPFVEPLQGTGDLRPVDAEYRGDELIDLVRAQRVEAGDADLDVLAGVQALARQLEHLHAQARLLRIARDDDHVAAADLEAERGRGGGVDLQTDIARQAGEPGLVHEVEVVAEPGAETCGDRAVGFGENPGARRQPLGAVDVARQLPAVHRAIQDGACAGRGGEAVHHPADSGGGAGHAEGEAADGADRMRAPDLAARLVAGAQNGIARVARRIRVQGHDGRLGKPQGGERPIGGGKNAGTGGHPGRELEADRGAAAAEGERAVARDGQPDAAERDLAVLTRRKGSVHENRQRDIRVGRGAEVHVHGAAGRQNVRVQRETPLQARRFRTHRDAPVLRRDKERIDTTVGRCPPAAGRLSADGS